MVKIMEKCNDCKLSSRRVSDGCEKVIYLLFFYTFLLILFLNFYINKKKIFMCIYLKNFYSIKPFITKAIISYIRKNTISVIIP